MDHAVEVGGRRRRRVQRRVERVDEVAVLRPRLLGRKDAVEVAAALVLLAQLRQHAHLLGRQRRRRRGARAARRRRRRRLAVGGGPRAQPLPLAVGRLGAPELRPWKKKKENKPTKKTKSNVNGIGQTWLANGVGPIFKRSKTERTTLWRWPFYGRVRSSAESCANFMAKCGHK